MKLVLLFIRAVPLFLLCKRALRVARRKNSKQKDTDSG